MSYDLKDQIREVADFIHESQAPIRGSDIRAGTVGLVSGVDDVSRPLKKVLIVAAAFVLVLIVLGGVAWLAPFGGGTSPVDEPTVTTILDEPTVTTILDEPTVPEATLLLEFPVSELPPFQLEVRYQLDPGVVRGTNEVPEDLEALMIVSYGGPDLLRVDVMRSVQLFFPEPGGPAPLHEAAGSFAVLNHGERVDYDAADGTFFLLGQRANFNPLYPLMWERWEDICTFGEHEFLETSPVAGRETVHIRCTNGNDSYELWVDAETGLMLRIVGKDIPGNLILISSDIQATEYEVLSVVYEPPFAPDTFSLSAPQDATVEDFRDVDDSMVTEGLLEGSAVPELAGELLSGGGFTLADLEGNRVALLFWASWCQVCLEALDELAIVADERADIMFVTVVIGDRPEDALIALAEHQIDLPVVIPDGLDGNSFAEQWGPGIPLLVLVETDGTVAGYHLGFGSLDLFHAFLEEANW